MAAAAANRWSRARAGAGGGEWVEGGAGTVSFSSPHISHLTTKRAPSAVLSSFPSFPCVVERGGRARSKTALCSHRDQIDRALGQSFGRRLLLPLTPIQTTTTLVASRRHLGYLSGVCERQASERARGRAVSLNIEHL